MDNRIQEQGGRGMTERNKLNSSVATDEITKINTSDNSVVLTAVFTQINKSLTFRQLNCRFCLC